MRTGKKRSSLLRLNFVLWTDAWHCYLEFKNTKCVQLSPEKGYLIMK